jgi:hypothetical protein
MSERDERKPPGEAPPERAPGEGARGAGRSERPAKAEVTGPLRPPEGEELDEEALAALAEAGERVSGPEPRAEDEPARDADQGELDEVDVRDLLRAALRPPPGSVAPHLLRGVQRRLRVRSRGKFYGDGWSTARSPRSTYLVTSLLMLAVILLVFVVLIPWAGTALR